jgi:hypothetical protein
LKVGDIEVLRIVDEHGMPREERVHLQEQRFSARRELHKGGFDRSTMAPAGVSGPRAGRWQRLGQEAASGFCHTKRERSGSLRWTARVLDAGNPLKV